MRSLVAPMTIALAAALLAAPARAQSPPGGQPVTLSQQRAGKSTAPKADEQAYKDALTRIPPAKEKQQDPWKTMR
jgi:hypothetical protein